MFKISSESEISDETAEETAGGGIRVSYTQMPALNYYICIFYNTPIVSTSNESMNNLVIMSYLSVLNYYETLLYSDDDLFYSVFKAEDVYITTTPTLYLFFYFLLKDIRKDISYNLLEYFLWKNTKCVEMFDDLNTIFDYLYSGLCIEIPLKTCEIIEENINNGIIEKDEIFEKTESYFNELYQKAQTRNVDKKYLTPYAFMYMLNDYIDKPIEPPNPQLRNEINVENDLKDEINEIKDELKDEIKDELKDEINELKDEIDLENDFERKSKSPRKSPKKSSKKLNRKSPRRSNKSNRKSPRRSNKSNKKSPRKSSKKSPRKSSRRSSRKSSRRSKSPRNSLDKTRKLKQFNFEMPNIQYPYDERAPAAAAAGFNI